MQNIFLLFFIFIGSALFATEAAKYYEVNKDIYDTYKLLIQEKIPKIGFDLYESHPHINEAYAEQFGNKDSQEYDKEYKKNLEFLDFHPIANDLMLSKALPLVPELGAFFPFNLYLYKKIQSQSAYIGYPSPEYIIDVLELDAEKKDAVLSLFKPLDFLLERELAPTTKKLHYRSLETEKMYTFVIDLEDDDQLEDLLEEFQGKLEELLEESGYIITGYTDLKERFEEKGITLESFDTYKIYSFCHFSFSYNIFNKGRPDIGVLAPCSLYIYKQKESNKIMVGISRLANWKSAMLIQDQKMLESIDLLDKEILSILLKIGVKKYEK